MPALKYSSDWQVLNPEGSQMPIATCYLPGGRRRHPHMARNGYKTPFYPPEIYGGLRPNSCVAGKTAGPKKGKSESLIEALPSFPANISAGLNGRYWVALASPRNPLVGRLAGKPFLRKVIQRLPAFLRPQAVAYSHIIAVDENGKVLVDLQDPSGKYPINSSFTETNDHLYIGSLIASELGRLSKEKINF
jgi:hypothetical protein